MSMPGNPGRSGGGGRRIYGVVVGIVSNIADPEQIGRVKVTFPWMGDGIESHWARVLGQYAGNSRGMMHIPEIGDQVMVGFDDGDPAHPYVIGAVYNGQHAVPGPGNPDGKNDHKYFRSRAGHDFEFLETDGGEKIRLVDSSTNNSIIFDTAEDTIRTKAATGSITIRAPEGVVKMQCVDLKITTKESRGVEVGTTHSVTVGSNRTVGVNAGNLVQTAGSSLSVTTPQMEASTDTQADLSAGAMTMNQGSMSVDVSSGAMTKQGPTTRLIGSLESKGDVYTSQGLEGPTGTFTLMGGMLNTQIGKGGGLLKGSANATIMAGLINTKSSSMVIGKDPGGAAAAASIWLGGLMLLNPKMLTFPAVKLLDPIMGLDFHTSLPAPIPPPAGPWPPLIMVPTPFMGPILVGFVPTVLVNFRPAAGANATAISFHMPYLPWPWPPISWTAFLKAAVMQLIQIPFSIMLNMVKSGLQSMLAATDSPVFKQGALADFLGTTYAQQPPAGESHFSFTRAAAAYADPQMIASMLIACIPLPVANASVTFGSSSVTAGGKPFGMAMPLGANSCNDPPMGPLPNAMVTTFSNVLVGISLGDLLGQIMWAKFERKANAAYMKGMSKVGDGAAALARRSNVEGIQNTAQRVNDFLGGKNCIAEGHPVDVVSGTLFTEADDFTLFSAQDVVFRRFYNSRYPGMAYDSGELGPGWHHSLDQILIADESVDGIRSLALRDDEGRLICFEQPMDDGGEAFNPFERLTLTRIDGRTYEIRDLDNRVRVFRFPGGEGRKTGENYLPGVQNVARLQAIIQPMGGAGVRPKWDRKGRLQGFTDPAGREVICKHDPQGRLTELRLVSSGGQSCDVFLAAYEYTAEGRLRSHIDRNRNRRRYAYDSIGRMVKETDRNGYSFHFEHDATDRCVRTYGDDNSFWVELEYLPGLTVAKDALGGVTRYKHDPELSKVTQIEDALGGVKASAYNEYGWLTEQTDPAGNASAFEYDDRGRMVSATDANGGSTKAEYDAEGHLACITDAGKGETRFARDGLGLVVEAITPAGRKRRIMRDERGLPAALIAVDDDGAETKALRHWSKAGLLLGETLTNGVRRQYGYDALGRLTKSTELATDGQAREMTLKRDGEGRITAIDGPAGRRERFEVMPEGQPTRLSIGTRTAKRRYAGWGRLVEHTDPIGRSTRIDYDLHHMVTAVHLPGDRAWIYERDLLGRVTRMVTPDNVEARYGYDPAGRMVEEQRADRTIERVFDGNGNVIQVDWGRGQKTQFTYDSLGRLTAAEGVGERSDEEAVSRTYDGDGLLITEAVGDHVIRHRHDTFGRRTRRSGNWGLREAFSHDGGGLTGVVDATGGRHAFLRDGFGRRSGWEQPGGMQRLHEWDALGRMTRDALHHPGGDVAVDRRLTWTEDDTIAAVEQRTDGPNGARITRDDYRYDDAGRLTGWAKDGGAQRSYAFDAADNLLEEPNGPDREYVADRLVSDGAGSSYRYDTDGRLVSIARKHGTTRLWFDARNRLTRVHTADDRVVHHRYDALGRRIETLAEAADGGVSVEQFAYDGDQLARRIIRDPATREIVRDETYTYDPEFERPLFRLVRGGDREDQGHVQYYTTDQRGAVVRLTAADGTDLWVGHADPYGRYREEGPEVGRQPLRMAGQVYDEATGLCHHRFRVYDPTNARFISADPLGQAGGSHAYTYPTDPISRFDPLGLTECLNLGSGENPMEGAVNADIRNAPGVDVVLPKDWNSGGSLPFASNSFDVVHVVNPYGFNPVHPEVARVLKPGGTLIVTGSPKNKYAKPMGDNALSAGFNQVGTGPMTSQHSFGTQAYTDGRPLPTTDNHITTVYEKAE